MSLAHSQSMTSAHVVNANAEQAAQSALDSFIWTPAVAQTDHFSCVIKLTALHQI